MLSVLSKPSKRILTNRAESFLPRALLTERFAALKIIDTLAETSFGTLDESPQYYGRYPRKTREQR